MLGQIWFLSKAKSPQSPKIRSHTNSSTQSERCLLRVSFSSMRIISQHVKNDAIWGEELPLRGSFFFKYHSPVIRFAVSSQPCGTLYQLWRVHRGELFSQESIQIACQAQQYKAGSSAALNESWYSFRVEKLTPTEKLIWTPFSNAFRVPC